MSYSHPPKAESLPQRKGWILQHLTPLSSPACPCLAQSACSGLYGDSTWDPGLLGFLDNHPTKTETAWPPLGQGSQEHLLTFS